MEYVAELFLAPFGPDKAILYAILGAIGGGLGSLIGYVISAAIGRNVTTFVTALGIGAASLIPIIVKPYFEKNYTFSEKPQVVEDVLSQLEEQRIFATIFRIYPDERNAFKEDIARIIMQKDLGAVAVKSAALDASAFLVAKYVQKHMLSAPDQQISAMLRQNFSVLKDPVARPELCVDYYLGKPNLQFSEFQPDFLRVEGDLKADIIEESVRTPSLPEKAENFDQVVELIVNGYASNGISLDSLSKIENLEAFPPQEACQAAIDFSAVMASFDAPTGSFVFKNLLLASGQNTQ